MEDKPLTESINKQYSKYGSLRTKEKESKIELCNAEDPLKFLTRIDSSIKDAKARVKRSIDNSTISEEFYESSYDQHQPSCDISQTDVSIPMVKLDRNRSSNTSISSIQKAHQEPSPSTVTNSQYNDSSNCASHESSQSTKD